MKTQGKLIICVTIAMMMVALFAACSDDDKNEYKIDFTEANVAGSWALGNLSYKNTDPTDSLLGSTVTFSSPSYSVTKDGQTLERGTYRVARFYVAITPAGSPREDTLQLVNPDVDFSKQLVLRRYLLKSPEGRDNDQTVTYTLTKIK